MKKDILNRAVALADRKTVRPETIVVAAKPEAMTCRLYTRITPSEMTRLEACMPEGKAVWTLLRNLLLDYLDTAANERKTKKK